MPAGKGHPLTDSYHAMMVIGANGSQYHPKMVRVTGGNKGKDHHQADDLRLPCRLWQDSSRPRVTRTELGMPPHPDAAGRQL